MAGTGSTGGGMGAMGYAGLIAQGISNTIAAFGGLGVTKYQNAIAQSQANIARINASMMMGQYEASLRAGEKQAAKVQMQAGRVKAAQQAALAANGVDVNAGGSASELQASTDIVKAQEVDQIQKNALNEAWGYRMLAVNYKNQALMSEAQKQNKWQVFGVTLLGGASQAATNWGFNYLANYGGNSSKSSTTEATQAASTYNRWSWNQIGNFGKGSF